MARALALLVVVVIAVGCRPDLPLPHEDPGSPSDAPLGLTFEPAATTDAAPQVVRIHVNLPADEDLAEVALVEGDVGAASLRSIASGDLSDALAKRIVASAIWRDLDGTTVIAPESALDLGATYSVAAPPTSLRFHVTKVASTFLPKVWPPNGASATNAFAVWCGDDELPAFEVKATFDPGALSASFTRGLDGAIGGRCVSARASPNDPAAVLVAPPAITVAAKTRTLEPGAIAIEVEAPPKIEALGCEDDEVAFGSGCGRVLDDRVLVRSPAAPLLWGVSSDFGEVVAALGPSEGFNVLGLPPSSSIALRFVVIDSAGVATSSMFEAATSAPAGHVVINEVMANPIGPEPAQEWVELINDGLAAAQLGGLSILDDTGATPLPMTSLAKGEIILVVPEDFVEDDGVDVAPALGTTIVRVPKLGDHGLSNEGELLRLVDSQGVVLSRFPALPKPKSGESVARLTPGASDLAASSFHLAKPSPGSMNPTQ